MKHTLAAACAVAARGSITEPHAPYMLIVYALAEKIESGELKPGDQVPGVTELERHWPGPVAQGESGTCNVNRKLNLVRTVLSS